LHECPCGYYSDPIRECTCSSNEVARYKRRISGPLLDRIDMFVEVPRVDYEKLTQPSDSESSSQVRERVEEARQRQYSRFKDTSILTNAEMGPTEVWNLCQMDDTAKALLNSAMKQMQLSARGFHRILKVSRTIADLAGEPIIGIAHLAEALQYRPTGESL